MDRLTQLRGGAGGSKDSTLNTTATSEAYLTANESSKYFSLTEEDPSFDMSPIKDVSLASTVSPEKNISGNDQLISNLSPPSKKTDLLDSYKFTKQIEAANILSGGVDIFDDNDNSYDGDELVIDDNVDMDEKSNSETKLSDNPDLQFQKTNELGEPLDNDPDSDVASKDSEVVLQIDGKNVNAIDIGNGLYLYRKAGEEELAAVQIVADDNDQPSFKFLKVRENDEGNLEVYEEIEIEVPKEVPAKDESTSDKKPPHVPVKDVDQVMSDSASNIGAESKTTQQEIFPSISAKEYDDSSKLTNPENKSESNFNGKMMKYNETRKSPVIHSTPNKEGIPLTKTMVDLQLHPNRQLDKVKTIEVHTDTNKQKPTETKSKHMLDDPKSDKESEKLIKFSEISDVKNSAETFPETIVCDKISVSKPVDNPKTDFMQNIQNKDLISSDTMALSNSAKSNQSEPDKPDIVDERKTIAIADNNPILSSEPKTTDKVNISKAPNTIISVVTDVTAKSSMKKFEITCPGSKMNNNNTESSTVKNATIAPGEISEVIPSSDSSLNLKNTKTNEKKEPDTIEIDSKILTSKNQTIQEKNSSEYPEERSNEYKNIVSEVVISSDFSEKKLESNLPLVTSSVASKIISSNTKGQTNKQKSVNTDLEQKPEKDVPLPIMLAPSHCSKGIEKPKPELNTKCENTKTVLPVDSKPESTGLLMPEKIAKENFTSSDANKIKSSNEKNSNVNNYDNRKNETLKQAEVEIKLVEVVPPKELKTEKRGINTEINQDEVKQKKTTDVTSCPVGEKNNYFQNIGNQSNKPKLVTTSSSNLTSADVKPTSSKNNLTQQPEWFTSDTSNKIDQKLLQNDNKQQSTANVFVEQAVPICLKGHVFKDDPKKINILKIETVKAQPILTKSELQKRQEDKNMNNVILDKKLVNNNNAEVPFGQWTDTNRQDFLNKIRETKVTVSSCNTKQIKQANDLNRRDVLQKFNSQRQSNIALSKTQELNKTKAEVTFINKPAMTATSMSFRESKPSTKIEKPKSQPLLLKKLEKIDTHQKDKTHANATATSVLTKPEDSRRKEINNQDLIDKTIEGIINRVVSVKPQDSKPNPTDFEQKMNELHGIPFVERPLHELPMVYNRDIKTYGKSDNTHLPSSKTSKIPSLKPIATNQQKSMDVKDAVIDLDSEEEIIEHEPVTGDIGFFKENTSAKYPTTVSNVRQSNVDLTKKEPIITENDFDKFHRRNSVSYEDGYVNKKNSPCAKVDVGAVKKSTFKPTHDFPDVMTKLSKQKPCYGNMQTNKLQMTSKLVPVDETMFNTHQSKLQQAYQNALTTKRQMESPITIIEDKPVKVVFMDSSTDYLSSKMNVQSQQLSPNKKQISVTELDSVTVSTGDSLDSDILDSLDIAKIPDEKAKTKHQRKQVLTPVETPELELIVPGDLGIEVSPKKKRKTEDHTKQDKNSKNVVPKKSYLLGRSVPADNLIPQNLTKDASKETDTANVVIAHNDTASAIDNLVKAAELLETQSVNFKGDTMPITVADSPQIVTPMKRGRGRPRKHPLPEGVTSPDKTKSPNPQTRSRLIDVKQKRISLSDESTSSDEGMVKENWTMGKINENIVCPICSKLFRSENVVFKHVKHCTGPSPNRSDSDKHSRRRSRFSHDSSLESKFDSTDGDSDKPLSKKSTPKKRRSKGSSVDKNYEMVIENAPIKIKKEKSVDTKPEMKKQIKTKAEYKVSSLSCEYCGKTFRQLSYLVNHRQLHKKSTPKVSENENQITNKTVFSCEVCKKEFRKLHHLVQHRIIHNPSSSSLKPSRKSSAEQNFDSKITKEQEVKQSDDQSAGFRCEPCDKSFRKLHHLVEHRETHDGINRQKHVLSTQSTVEKTIPDPPPQCDVCKKTFRKLHHLIEHKEQHMETSSDKSDDKSVKSSLSTRDIIHECSLCYMVFPNEHSLTKHSVICQRKRRQSAQKQSEKTAELESKEITPENEIIIAQEPASPKIKDNLAIELAENKDKSKPSEDLKEIENLPEIREKRLSKEPETKTVVQTLPSKPVANDSHDSHNLIDLTLTPKPEIPLKIKKNDLKLEKVVINTVSLKKKTPVKVKEGATVGKRRRSNLPLTSIEASTGVESSDEDEIRYMLNPDYKESLKNETESVSTERDIFMKCIAKKRNSLQFEKPKLKFTPKKRMSVQCLPKMHRAKSNGADHNEIQASFPSTVTKTTNLESAHSTDSDDSDVKYSFPEKVPKTVETEKTDKVSKIHTPKEKRNSMEEKRKILSGIAKRKSLGKLAAVKPREKVTPVKVVKKSVQPKAKAAPVKEVKKAVKSREKVTLVKEVKKRSGPAEHRCDCGQVFYSAALLARHTSLAHTPPRVRRPRAPPSPPPAPAAAETRRLGRPSGAPTPARRQPLNEATPAGKRKTPAHRGVPLPAKMKKIMEK